MVAYQFNGNTNNIVSGDLPLMSNPSLSGGGGITLDDVLVMLYNRSGGSTENGVGAARYELAFSNTEVT